MSPPVRNTQWVQIQRLWKWSVSCTRFAGNPAGLPFLHWLQIKQRRRKIMKTGKMGRARIPVKTSEQQQEEQINWLTFYRSTKTSLRSFFGSIISKSYQRMARAEQTTLSSQEDKSNCCWNPTGAPQGAPIPYISSAKRQLPAWKGLPLGTTYLCKGKAAQPMHVGVGL